LLKAMTVDYLFNDTFPLHGGETVLFHAAAGGVGLIACQWARHLGRKPYRHGKHARKMRPRHSSWCRGLFDFREREHCR
jgi:NADPH:quinone reductase-like Zn-dependent oxidoreductase